MLAKQMESFWNEVGIERAKEALSLHMYQLRRKVEEFDNVEFSFSRSISIGKYERDGTLIIKNPNDKYVSLCMKYVDFFDDYQSWKNRIIKEIKDKFDSDLSKIEGR